MTAFRLANGTMLHIAPSVLDGSHGDRSPSASARRSCMSINRGGGNSLTGEIIDRAYVGVSTQLRSEDLGGRRDGVRPGGRGSQHAGRAARACRVRARTQHSSFSRPEGESPMNDLFTRDQVLRRALAGGAFPQAFPGLLAACGGSKKACGHVDQRCRKDAAEDDDLFQLAPLHRHQREDEDSSVARGRSRSTTGVNVKYVEDIQRQRQPSSGRSKVRLSPEPGRSAAT